MSDTRSGQSVIGHEQTGVRPVVVVSVDALGTGSSELALVVPCTTTPLSPTFHVRIAPLVRPR